jgi:hypothetical protein
MRYVHSGFGVLVGILALLVILLGGQLPAAPSALAQDSDQCEQLAAQAVSEATSACTGLVPGEICFGSGGVVATALSGDTSLLAASGDKTTIADVQSLTAANLETGAWGIATVMLPAGLPEGSAVMAVLFGEAQIARPAQAQSDRPTLNVFNRGSAPVNLRNGAGVTYDVVGQLAADQETVADGRNQEADWVRIQFGDGVAWVFVPLIGWQGEQDALNALEVLLPNDVTPSMQATGEPFQAFTLTTGGVVCPAALSGMLLQYTGEQAAMLQVNHVNLEFSNATLLLVASANGDLEVRALAGSATVTARGIPEEVTVGAAARVSLGGEDGLTPEAAPTVFNSYAFADAAYAPLGLLPEAMTCMVGLPVGSVDLQLRVGPGEQRGLLGTMNPDRTYSVIGWANDPDGNPWWQLDTGETPSWVAQSDVRAVGTCDGVAQVEPPPLVFAPPPVPPTGDGGDVISGDDLAPAANSVWQMKPGSDNLSGTCSGAPAINFCDHLAAIAPASGGITWRGMEASPYYLVRIQPNVYAYSGPNILGTGTINLTLSFTSETTLKMTMSLVLNSEPDCQHVYFYSGTKNW